MMKRIAASTVTQKVRDLCIEANCILSNDVLQALEKAEKEEESQIGREIISQLIENARIAREEMLPLCQDTGVAVFFVEMGTEVFIEGNLIEAINEGVRKGYTEGYLRKSIVADPLNRVNTGDNTPAIVHVDIVPGDQLKIYFLPKGGGSENMSGIKMLTPAAGKEGIIDFVVQKVKEAGSNPCPPIVVGVGIGGTFEKAAILAKKALLRPLGMRNPRPDLASLEEEILTRINNLGIGPQGFGGRITALAVNILTHPCHITALPVAVNIECHAHRHKEIVL